MTPEESELRGIRESGSWSRYEIYVMETLATLKSDVGRLRHELAEYKRTVDADIAQLKVKVGAIALLAGAIGGAIPVAIVLFLK